MPRKHKSKMTPEELEALRTYYREYQRKRKENISKEEQDKKKELIKQRNKSYKEINKEVLKEKRKKYVDENKDKVKQGYKNWAIKNKEKRKEYRLIYQKNNRNKINSNKKERRLNDHLYKITENVRNLIKAAIKRKNHKKQSKTIDILGCTHIELQKHLESKFESWMTWENYGLYNGEVNYGWDIDHIIPNNTANDYNELIKLNHYTNLQPLCSHINRDVKRYNHNYLFLSPKPD